MVSASEVLLRLDRSRRPEGGRHRDRLVPETAEACESGAGRVIVVGSSVGDVIVREIASGARNDAGVSLDLVSASGSVCIGDATDQVSAVSMLVPQERLNGCRDGDENW